jgi:hypothetical protein
VSSDHLESCAFDPMVTVIIKVSCDTLDPLFLDTMLIFSVLWTMSKFKIFLLSLPSSLPPNYFSLTLFFLFSFIPLIWLQLLNNYLDPSYKWIRHLFILPPLHLLRVDIYISPLRPFSFFSVIVTILRFVSNTVLELNSSMLVAGAPARETRFPPCFA